MVNKTPSQITVDILNHLKSVVGEENVLIDDKSLNQLSKDFYWYSPVLKRKLEDKRAEVVLLISDLNTLRTVVSYAFEHGIAMAVRGGATGNYGQIIPLFGGILLDLNRMNTIYEADEILRTQPGAKLGAIEKAANLNGWEMRCMPSTWATASIGGFLAGGAGGIGSITYGGLNHTDNIKSVTLLTIEAEPKLITFHERDCMPAIHNYGTTGILVEIEMRLGKHYPWRQLIFTSTDWRRLLSWTNAIAQDTSIRKRLVTLFEDPIPSFFTPLLKHLTPNHHTTFLFIEASQADSVIQSAQAENINFIYNEPLASPPAPPFLSNYTWNHTTLWAIKKDPAYTYLQTGFGDNFAEQFALLKARFPDEIFFHLEWIKSRPKMVMDPNKINCGGLPIIRFTTEERLQEIIDYCGEIGVFVANPHTYIMEEAGRHPELEEKIKLKHRADPKGLLNPGKMKSFPINPFATELKATA